MAAGEVGRRQRPQVKASGAGPDLDVVLELAHLEADFTVGERARDLNQEATRDDDGTGALGRALEAHLEGHLHVGCAQRQSGIIFSRDVDARKGLQGRPRGNRSGDDEQRVEQRLA